MAEAKQQLDRWNFWEFSKVGDSYPLTNLSNWIHRIAFHDWLVHFAEQVGLLSETI